MKTNKIIILLGLLGFIAMADNWVVSPILPAIAESLGIPVENAGILISAYMIPFGIFQIIYGPLADRFGKKQIITFAILFFTVATGLCALGGKMASAYGLSTLFLIYGVMLGVALCLSFFLIKTPGRSPLPAMRAGYQSGD